MDLTFQVPMQYCSLKHQTLLLSPVTSTTGCYFCFGSVSSLFLKLFLHSSPGAYWAPSVLRSSYFSHTFLPFHTVHRVLKARILKGLAIPFSSGPRFVRTSTMAHLSYVAPHYMAHSFIALFKAVVHVMNLVSFL